MAGLTSLFGMGRGEHRRQYHHKIESPTHPPPGGGDVILYPPPWEGLGKANIETYWVSNFFKYCKDFRLPISSPLGRPGGAKKKIKAYVQLVLLGFDVTTFTPVAYQRHSL